MSLLFVSYSHKDEDWRKELEPHLRMLKPHLDLQVWSDRELQPGEDWRNKIRDAINHAEIAILLISADFLSSDFILDEEVPLILERRARGALRVVPLIVRFTAWNEVEWLREIQVWPRDATPLAAISRKEDREECLAALSKSLARTLNPSDFGSTNQRIRTYVEEESQRIWEMYRWRKGLLNWDLNALPIEITPNRARERDGSEIAAEELWKCGKRLILLLGPPACGKTTYCRRLQARPPSGFIPVDIGSDLPCPTADVLRILMKNLGLHGENEVQSVERQGNLLFIVDGVGERHAPDRVVESIASMAETLTHSSFLVTCRTGDWPEKKAWLPHFEKWFILDLNQTGWTAFLEKQDGELTRRVQCALTEQTELSRLCENQFLFLMAAKVLSTTDAPIPKVTRASLYGLFLDELLREWENVTPIAYEATVACLQDLAVEMRRSGTDRTRLSHSRTLDVLRRWLPAGVAQETLERELAHQYHIGLIEESKGGIRFFQERFQEYLCARWLTARFPHFPLDAEIESLCNEILGCYHPTDRPQEEGDADSEEPRH